MALVIVHGAAVSCFIHVVGEIRYLHLRGYGVGTDPPDVRSVGFRIVVGEEFKGLYDGIGDALPPEVVEGEVGILYDIVEQCCAYGNLIIKLEGDLVGVEDVRGTVLSRTP